MAGGLESIAKLPDPLGKILEESHQPNGLHIRKIAIPLGVIGMIYEARPNVTADAGGLCIKSGNAVILRCGSEAFFTSQAILAAMQTGLQKAGLPIAAIQLIPDTDRSWVGAMLQANGLIDVIIPRGGRSLTERVQRESRVPTLLHLDGNCHSYIHSAADIHKAIKLVVNAKMRRTGICGATESLLIDAAIAPHALPLILQALREAGCSEIRGDEASRNIDATLQPATEEDWFAEYLAPMISVKIVASLQAAIAHINHYGSHHTDAIITEDAAAAQQFLREVDSAIVMHNTSTQFADGGEFGMGAEIGIATGRMHARGPVGAAQLTTYKYLVASEGAIRAG
jgi:glutamate-5-semialdehyde dehydrogenase